MSESLVSPSPARAGSSDRVSPFEHWPGWLFYTPVVVHWLLLGCRYGNWTLPTAANPHIESGGLCGESKTSILDQVEGEARALLGRYATLLTGTDDLSRAQTAMAAAEVGFPLVVKPDIGCHGAGVRLVRDGATLAETLPQFPRDVRLVLQEFIPFAGEAGVFYVRRPAEARGHITSLTLKHPPMLHGDGRHTIRDLVLADERLRKTARKFFARLGARADEVLASGETMQLVFTGNHCNGSVFRDGRNEITAALTARIDAICASLPDFHFGRIDLRYRDLASLRAGTDFRVIEINGVGSEATHIWDPHARLLDAYRTQFWHYAAAFAIGDTMRRRGHRPTAPLPLWRLWTRQSRLIASYPPND